MSDSRFCNSCNSDQWNTCSWCSICKESCCDVCGIVFSGQLICQGCINRASEVIDRIRPEFMDPLIELIEGAGAEVDGPNDPVTPELFEAIAKCKSVEEVKKAFGQFKTVVPVRLPIKPVGSVGTGQKRRAA